MHYKHCARPTSAFNVGASFVFTSEASRMFHTVQVRGITICSIIFCVSSNVFIFVKVF